MGRGGILDSVDFRFGPHETTPEVTDGSYLARVYAAEGYPVDPAPPIWTATTAYSVGTIIRPTSGANADLHFVYRCVAGGTSGASEPTWPGNGVDWATVTPGTTTNDGSVTWEALPGLHPVGAVSAADTPTPGWLAQSTVYAYAPGTADLTWKTLAFTGANRIRLEAGQWYIVILDWRPNDSVINNSLAVTNAANENAVMPGNVYLDGQAAANNGPRIIEDAWHVVREESTLIDATSGTDAGFANTVDGGDTDPFTSGEKASYTVQPGDELTPDVTYRWRVRAIDPDRSNLWNDWTGGTVTITSSTVEEAALGLTISGNPMCHNRMRRLR
jgi:hypothetical protein